ncbi:MAG: hypothetical protein IKP40_04210, partial [Clostridia bacterium]|nr:hypothetical protein [Clostridia bacterium]
SCRPSSSAARRLPGTSHHRPLCSYTGIIPQGSALCEGCSGVLTLESKYTEQENKVFEGVVWDVFDDYSDYCDAAGRVEDGTGGYDPDFAPIREKAVSCGYTELVALIDEKFPEAKPHGEVTE